MRTWMTILGVAALATGCASSQPNAQLEQAMAEVESTSSLAGVSDVAAANLEQAETALRKAQNAHGDGAATAVVDHYALLASKQSEIARERLKMEAAEEAIDAARRDRHDLLLQARDAEVRTARERALAAEARAELAALEAQAAREEMRSAKDTANQLAQQLDELKAEQSERGIVLTLDDIVFAFDSHELQPGGKRVAARIAEFLAEYSERQVLIEGHTDSVGAESYNLALSEKRAQSVKSALTAQGIAASRIKVQGLGEQYPIASNDTEAGRASNRRVEIVVSNQDNTQVEAR